MIYLLTRRPAFSNQPESFAGCFDIERAIELTLHMTGSQQVKMTRDDIRFLIEGIRPGGSLTMEPHGADQVRIERIDAHVRLVQHVMFDRNAREAGALSNGGHWTGRRVMRSALS